MSEVPEQIEQPVVANTATAEDDEIAALKSKMEEIEKEAAKLREMQEDAYGHNDESNAEDAAARAALDSRSVYVGNVDYSTTPEELQKCFSECGSINRVTILTDKFTGNPKGFAYVEFSDPTMVEKALELNDTSFKNRSLKVVPKRTNIHGFNRGRGGPMRGRGGMSRGRGGRGRGGFRGRGGPRGRGGRFTPY